MTFAEANAWVAEHGATFTVAKGRAILEAYGERVSITPGILDKDMPQMVDELRRKTGR